MAIRFNTFRFINGGSAAFLIVVCAAYISAFTTLIFAPHNLSRAEIIALSTLGIAYLIIGTAGFSYCRQAGSVSAGIIYLIVQLVLASVMILLRGPAVELPLILLPLAGQSALLLSLRPLLAVCSLIYLILVMPLLLEGQWVNAVIVALVHGTGIVFAVVFTLMAARERDVRLSLSEANLKLLEHAAQIEELATTKERNRLAREIHDSLGHYLTVANVQIEAARAVFARDANLGLHHLAQAQALTQEGLVEIRRSVAALRSSPLSELPLAPALQKLAEQRNTVDTKIELTVTGAVRRLSPAAEVTFYRTAQEGLTNVSRHADATQVNLRLVFGINHSVILRIEDNGRGSENTEGGFGLLGIRERIQALGGKVKVSTAAGKGFTLEVEVPE